MTGDLQSIISGLNPNDTVLFENGIYNLNGSYLWVSAPGATLRGKSGNPADVIIDGNYTGTELITVSAPDVTVAEMTITKAFTHPIHITANSAGDISGTLIYRVHIIDPREQGIKINPDTSGHFADSGTIACSTIELTDAGRPHINPASGGCYTGGIDAHQARDWTIRDNTITGFYCSTGLSEHAIHLWRGGRDTLVERNTLINNARGIGFGLADSGDARTYSDNPCPEAGSAYVDHYGGIIRNNTIFANSQNLFDTPDGFDCGICLWSACKPKVIHNTVVSTGANFSSIEWRFAGAQGVEITNNIATHPIMEREDANGTTAGNIEQASLSLFINGADGDLHPADGSDAIDSGVAVAPGLCDNDKDLNARDSTPDAGAYEHL
jgi:hypothetical protein